MQFTKLHPLYRAFFCLICTCAAFTGNAQHTKAIIQGVVTDSAQSKPIAYATVGLYRSLNHEKPIKNTITNNKGGWVINVGDTGSFVIIATGTGFMERSSYAIHVSSDTTIDLPTLQLRSSSGQLQSVTVTARKPLIELAEDKLIYNTEADPSTAGEMATDLLKKAPFITVDGEGNIKLNGQGNFKILLNSKETSMFAKNAKEALQSFPASLIKSIEVITTPSSKYDGEGVGGVINIITKKKVSGYNGSLSVSENTLGGTNGNANISIKYGKLGFSAYYGLNHMNGFRVRNFSETESFQPIAYYKRHTEGLRKNQNLGHWSNLELSYDIDSLNTVSAYGALNAGRSGNTNNRDIYLIMPNKLDTTSSRYIDNSQYRYPSQNWGIDFIHRMPGNTGEELTVKMFHDYSTDRSFQYSDQYNENSNWFIRNINNSINRQSTWQLDHTKPFSKKIKLETGLKLISRRASTAYESSHRSSLEGPYIADNDNADNFRYKQIVYGSYASFIINWEQYTIRAGVRAEQTTVEGEFEHAPEMVKQDYLSWLPSLLLSRKFNKKNTLSLSYSKRLSRPYIWDLNPFVNNTDTLSLYSGNPHLNPEFYHATELGFMILAGKTTINLRLSETFSNNQIVRYSTFNPHTGITYWNSGNIGQYTSTGLTGNINITITSKWRLSSNLSLRYDFIKNKLRPAEKNQGPGGYGNLNTSVDLNKWATVYFNAMASRSPALLQGSYGLNYSYNIGGNIKLFDKKLTVSVNVNNILLNKFYWHSVFENENYRTVSDNIRPGRSANLTVRWSFGKLSENVSRKRGINNDDLKSNN